MSEHTPLSDPRLNFLELISLEKSYVPFDPPLILLFGGDMTQEYGSFRERLNHFAVAKLQLAESMRSPEEFPDWLHDSKYNDLLEFEFDLAHLSTYVVIILETAGSIAELGAFAVEPSCKDKVLVVIEEEHYKKESFIKLGLLKRFKNENIFSYPISFLKPQGVCITDQEHMSNETYTETLKSLLEDLEELIVQKDKSKKKFSHDDLGHQSFLVYEIVNMFLALKRTEIVSYLKELGIELKPKKLNNILYLLLKLDLLECTKEGNQDYYFCLTPEKSRFRFSSTSKENPFDRTIVPVKTSQFYRENSSEDRRVRFIKRHSIGITE